MYIHFKIRIFRGTSKSTDSSSYLHFIYLFFVCICLFYVYFLSCFCFFKMLSAAAAAAHFLKRVAVFSFYNYFRLLLLNYYFDLIFDLICCLILDLIYFISNFNSNLCFFVFLLQCHPPHSSVSGGEQFAPKCSSRPK